MNKTARNVASVAAATILGSGLALGAAPQAQAAATVWDRVAHCESTGRWSINTGNGYYGGLQFSASTWRGFGGREYAAYAHQATKAEQIAVARRVLAGQGPGAWPVCSKKAGLTKATGGASRTATPTGTSTATAKPAAAKRVTKTTVTKKAVATKATPAPRRAAVKQSPASGSYVAKRYVTVRSGDTLSKLAARHDVTGGWKKLWQLNRGTVSNANRIFVGQRLAIG